MTKINLPDFKTKWDNSKEISTWENCTKILKAIEIKGVTILTGENASGKSLIRSQLTFKVDKEIGSILKHASMSLRTRNDPSFGAFSSAGLDTDWIATSQNTFHMIDNLFKMIEKDDKKHYICLDEFEIGCGEETVLALINYINEKTEKLNDRVGFLIITHSRLAVEKLNYDAFFNIQGLTSDEYINRKLIPTDLEELSKNKFFTFIQDLEKLDNDSRKNLFK